MNFINSFYFREGVIDTKKSKTASIDRVITVIVAVQVRRSIVKVKIDDRVVRRRIVIVNNVMTVQDRLIVVEIGRRTIVATLQGHVDNLDHDHVIEIVAAAVTIIRIITITNRRRRCRGPSVTSTKWNS